MSTSSTSSTTVSPTPPTAPTFSDNSSLVITNHKFNGKNFLHWSHLVLMVIRGCGKLAYLTGDLPRPSVTDPTSDTWELITQS